MNEQLPEGQVDAFLLREPLPARSEELAAPLYRAVDTTNGDEVLVAALWELQDDGSGWVSSLYDRALELSRIEHRSLPPLVASASPGQLRPFVSWTLPPGETLRSRFDRGAYPNLGGAVRIALALSEGLAALHAAGELHGALSPANVLADEDGGARLLAPGLGPSVLGPTADPAGAAAYRAPEQLPGGDGPIGPASDLFSLGVILYEMLECQRPYRAASASELRERMELAPPPTLASVPGHLPRELEEMLARTLQPRPGERFKSADSAAERLRALLRLVDPTPTVTPQPAVVAHRDPPFTPAPRDPAHRRTPARPRMQWSLWLRERRRLLESQHPSLVALWVVPGLVLALLVALALWYRWG